MNWKLIFTLSLFGLVMAIASVFWIPENIEWIFWVVILLISAYVIARNAPGRYFLHGLMVCIVNSIWITIAHITFYTTYVANHPSFLEMNARGPLAEHPKRMMAVFGPIVGVLSGIVLGLLALLFSRLVKRRAQMV
ncbi:MAG TPA: hypothetical protein VEV87_10295 [Chitinophagaceae bacterium]|nr:hypothetical protein [Chitinophagaceae bacterium]